MEPRAHHVFIGLFVVLLGAIGIGFALWLSDTRSDHDYQYYRIMFDEPVTGLTPGSQVQYSGITIGEVVALSLSPRDPRRAIARVRIMPPSRSGRIPALNWSSRELPATR